MKKRKPQFKHRATMPTHTLVSFRGLWLTVPLRPEQTPLVRVKPLGAP